MLDVYLTIDTECSMGGAWASPSRSPVTPERGILGASGARRYGTPLIMNLLEEHGLRGCFFVEMFAAAVVGEGPLSDACQAILARGHDVQLHLHPVFHYYERYRKGLIGADELPDHMDRIGRHSPEQQLELLEEGVRVFERLIGRKPLAFRAGNYAADHTTLAALEQVGIRYDTSFNAAYLGGGCLITGVPPTNSPWASGSLWEMPVTVFSTGTSLFSGLKPLEISAVSFWEIESVLDQAERLGMGSVTMVLHSFSLFKKADSQFSRIRPDRLLIRRMRRLCRHLGSNRHRFRVTTYSDLPTPRVDPPGLALPRMGLLVPAARRVVQGLNRPFWV